MKKIVLISAIVIMSGFIYNTANAQFSLHVGFHFGPRRVFIPARVIVQTPPPVEYTEPADYQGDEDYYYLPDIDAYYSISQQCYYYMDGSDWISAAYLPGSFHDFDWRYARHYEVRAPRPFLHNDYYRSRFNGAAFNGHWDHFDNHYYNGYARDNHFNQIPDHRGDRHFDNNRQPANDGHNYNNYNDRHNNRFADNDMHYTGGRPQINHDDHRSGRF